MKTIWKVLIAVIVILIGLRVALPFWLEGVINDQLHKLDKYDGRVEDVDLFILGGHYYVQDIKLWRIQNDTLPFVSIEEIDIGIDWSSIFEGKIVSTIFVESPKLNIVSSLDMAEEEEDKGKPTNWPEVIQNIAPAEIDRFELANGTVRFHDYSTSPDVNVAIDSLYVMAENLTNRENPNDSFPSHMDIRGVTTGGGNLNIKTDMNLLEEIPDVKTEFTFKRADLTEFNDFIKAYGNFDLEKGHLSMYSEVEVLNGQINGYIKPFFDEVIILNWTEDKKEKGFFHATYEAVVGLFKEVPEDQGPDVIATKVPFSGQLEKPDPDISFTILEMLRNAFIQALDQSLDHQIKVQGDKTDRIILQSPPFEE